MPTEHAAQNCLDEPVVTPYPPITPPLYTQPTVWSTAPRKDWRTAYDTPFDLNEVVAVIIHSSSKGLDRVTNQRRFSHEIRLVMKTVKFIPLVEFDDREKALAERKQLAKTLGIGG